MPSVEMTGLLVAAALVGGMIGGLLATRLAKMARRAAHEEEFIVALIGWLAARRNWRSSAILMIRKVRRLAQERRDSNNFEKYCRSARRAQREFCRASEKLVSAEAAMETWRGDGLERLPAPPPQPTHSQVRRVALRGGAERIDRLVRRLNLADTADLEWVRAERIRMRG